MKFLIYLNNAIKNHYYDIEIFFTDFTKNFENIDKLEFIRLIGVYTQSIKIIKFVREF